MSSLRVVPTLTKNDTALPHKRCEQYEHLLATACAAPRAGREEPTNVDDRDHQARRNDNFDNDHERDDYDDENYDTNCYGRRMKMRTHHDRDEQLFHINMHHLYLSILFENCA